MKHYLFGKANGTRVQLFRYLFVGGSATVVDIGVYSLFLYAFGAQLYLVYALAAYMVGLLWNHIFSLLWVFDSKHTRVKEITLVLAIALGGLFWTELFLWFGVDFFGFAPLPTKLVVVAIVLAWNFGLRKILVFD